jgi:hypothetical protein
MAIILLVPLVVTNLFMGAAVIKEGLDNMNTSKDPSGNSIKTNLQNKQATTSSTNSDDDSQSVLGDKDISNAKKIMTNAENAKNSDDDDGKCTYDDRRVYTGKWIHNTRNGQGTQTWPDGCVYEGSWSNGKFSGFGTLTYSDGQILRTNFIDNFPVAPGFI